MEEEIKEKIIEIANKIGHDASGIKEDDIIPLTGYLDSSGIIELVAWLEEHFKIEIDDEDINLENLGSINLMVKYLESHT